MFAALILGLFGSVGHCAGMCSGVALMLGRRSGSAGWHLLLLHLGRITTYGLMGFVAGAFGHALSGMGNGHGATLPGLSFVQGGLALIAAVLAVYMAVAFIGRAPSPELLLSRVTAWWGRTMRKLAVTARSSPRLAETRDRGDLAKPAKQRPTVTKTGEREVGVARRLATTFALGSLWGLLPCGLVLMALLLAAVAGSAQQGALVMLVFGVGTWPLTLAVSFTPRLQVMQRSAAPWVRPATAAIILVFGAQMALRGLAAWGLVDHLHIGGLAIW